MYKKAYVPGVGDDDKNIRILCDKLFGCVLKFNAKYEAWLHHCFKSEYIHCFFATSTCSLR